MIARQTITSATSYSEFSSTSGADEFCIAVRPPDVLQTHEETLDRIESEYCAVCRVLGLSDTTQVFSRLYVNDTQQTVRALSNHRLGTMLSASAFSVTGQPPLMSGCIALFSYHIRGKDNPYRRELHESSQAQTGNSLLLAGSHYRMLWNAGFAGVGGRTVHQQTTDAFDLLSDSVERGGMHFSKDSLRSWIFLGDIDSHYREMTQARKEFFTRTGMTESTRYLASTGINGKAAEPGVHVSIDLLSIGGLCPEQIVRMDALETMPPPISYGVTFERGLRIRFGDRSHLHLSGTASIDRLGNVLHSGNSTRQTERVIENIESLLRNECATLDDVAYLNVYLRNRVDLEKVAAVLSRSIPTNVPIFFLEAPVCRPEWLVEIDGLAIIEDACEFPAFM